MAKKPSVYVNQDCIGCGICTTIAPAVFKMNPENKSEAAKDAKVAQSVREASSACPVSAIKIEE